MRDKETLYNSSISLYIEAANHNSCPPFTIHVHPAIPLVGLRMVLNQVAWISALPSVNPLSIRITHTLLFMTSNKYHMMGGHIQIIPTDRTLTLPPHVHVLSWQLSSTVISLVGNAPKPVRRTNPVCSEYTYFAESSFRIFKKCVEIGVDPGYHPY